MKYYIDGELLKGLINYLSTRPYAEVHQAMNALQSLKEVAEETEKAK